MAGMEHEDGKLDLVPMIDTVMLLLLFFILTTKFSAEEKIISSLLPTDKGQLNIAQSTSVKPPEQINILIYPEGMGKGFQPSEYRKQLEALRANAKMGILGRAQFRIGGSAPILAEGSKIVRKGGIELKRQMDEINAYIRKELESREAGGSDRKSQPPIVISCFSGLSWKYALLAYDAVRDYERSKSGAMTTKSVDLNQAREVMFAPPRIRNYSSNELGNELYEIVQMR